MTDTMYKTGNPVPSADPKDRHDNSIALDEAVNSEKDTYIDRENNLRRTLKWMERAADGIAAIGAADRAENAADRAESAALASVTNGNVFASVAEGLAATPAGKSFYVMATESTRFLDMYVNQAGAAVYKSSSPSATYVIEAMIIAKEALAMSDDRSLSVKFPWAVADDDLNPILAVRGDGIAHAVLDELPGLPMISNYRWACVDADGVVLIGIKWTGEVIIYGAGGGSSDITFAQGPDGGTDIFVTRGDSTYQLTSSGNNLNPSVSSGTVTYASVGPVTTQERKVIPSNGELAAFVKRIIHILSSGQSLSMGDTSQAITLTAPAANRLLTIQSGMLLTNQDATLTGAMVSPFIPMRCAGKEVPAAQMAAQLNANRCVPADAALLTSCHGRNGRQISSLSKGTLYYNNMMTCVAEASGEANRMGLGYSIPFVDWIQGEADTRAAKGYYYEKLIQLQKDYTADIGAITGNPVEIPILLDQVSSMSNYNVEKSFVPLEQLQASLDFPDKFVLAGPKYWLDYNTDGTHMTAAGYARVGSMHRRAADAIINGFSWMPTHAVGAKRSGDTVVVEFYTPQGHLTVDTGTVSNPGNWGLVFEDSTGVVAIQSVKLLPGNKVEIKLASVPTGTDAFVGIADRGIPGQVSGRLHGARSCLRDSSTDKDCYGLPMYNWAVHQQIKVEV